MSKLIELEMKKQKLYKMIEKFEDQIEQINLELDKLNEV